MLQKLKNSICYLLFLLIVSSIGCSGAKSTDTAGNKTVGTTYKTGNAECDKALADLDEAIGKVNSDPNSSPERKNKAYLVEVDKRSLLKALDDPNNKPDEKLQITGKCREAFNQKTKDLNSMK